MAAYPRISEASPTPRTSGVAYGLLLRLRLPRQIDLSEVDGLELQRRETAFRREVADHAPREGKQIARALDHQDLLQVLLLDPDHLEDAGVDDFHLEDGVGRAARLGRHLEIDLEYAALAGLGAKL